MQTCKKPSLCKARNSPFSRSNSKFPLATASNLFSKRCIADFTAPTIARCPSATMPTTDSKTGIPALAALKPLGEGGAVPPSAPPPGASPPGHAGCPFGFFPASDPFAKPGGFAATPQSTPSNSFPSPTPIPTPAATNNVAASFNAIHTAVRACAFTPDQPDPPKNIESPPSPAPIPHIANPPDTDVRRFPSHNWYPHPPSTSALLVRRRLLAKPEPFL